MRMMLTGFHFEPGMPFFVIHAQDIPVLLVLMVVAVAAEAFMSQKDDWRVGLILPGGFLAWNVIRCVVRAVRYSPGLSGLFIALAAENIPTLILLIVYVLSRFFLFRRRRLARQMDKTRIDDL